MKKLLIFALVALGMLACTESNAPKNAKEGALNGEFSVSATKKVRFSQGNLQYKPIDNIWRFAEHQYDTIGAANENIALDYKGWISLFGWGTGDNPLIYHSYDYDWEYFVDWGINKISNGGNKPNVWRTLTIGEWEYIFRFRPRAQLLFGMGSVNGIDGVIVLPDDWKGSEHKDFKSTIDQDIVWAGDDDLGVNFYYCNSDDGFESWIENKYNSLSSSQWSKMEKDGAVFLPAALLSDDYIQPYNHFGSYWSSTETRNSEYPNNISFGLFNLFFSGSYLSDRRSVRLVQDVE